MSDRNDTPGDPAAKRVTARRLAFVLACALLPFVLLEGVLRVAGVEPIFDAHHAALPGLPKEPALAEFPRFITDDAGFWVANPDLPNINDQGFRTPPFDEDPGERPTVVFIGDSFAWGESAEPLENSFVDLVRNAGYRTVNLGIMGIGPVQYAALAERYLPELAPDAVVLVFYPGNDFDYEPPITPGRPRYYLTEELILAAYGPDGEPWTFEESYEQFAFLLGDTPAARIRRVLFSSRLISALARAITENDMHETTLPTVLDSLERVRAAATDAGAPFELLIAPVRPELRNAQNSNEYCAEVFAEWDPRIPEGFGAEFYAPMPDTHFDNGGHARYSEFVLEILAELGLEPRPDDPTHVPVTPFGLGKDDLAWHSVVQVLALDEDRAQELRAILDGLKDAFADLFSRPAAGGGPSPLEILADGLAQDGPGSEQAAQEAFLRYAAEHTEPESGQTYFEALSDVAAARMDQAREVLTSRQQGIFAHQYLDRVFDIDTGHDPLGKKVAGIMEARGDFPAGRRPDAPVADMPFAAFTAHLGLDPDEADAARETVDGLKRRFSEIFAKPADDGGPSPLEKMARLMADGESDEAERNARFEAYARSQSPEGHGGSYYQVFTEEAGERHGAFVAGLTNEQRARFGTAPIASLMDVDTGYNPFGERLMQAIAGDGAPAAAPGQDRHRDWDALADTLGLDDGRRDEIRGLIEELKAEYAAILAQPAASGNEAPAERLAALHAGEGTDDSRDFVQYLQEEREAITGETYAALLEAEEVAVRRKIHTLLNRAQREAFEGLVAGSLTDIDTTARP